MNAKKSVNQIVGWNGLLVGDMSQPRGGPMRISRNSRGPSMAKDRGEYR
jgi:murein endopeptidase